MLQALLAYFDKATITQIISIISIGAFFIALIVGIYRSAHLEWADLITSKGTNHVSLTKLLQFVGGSVATWIVIRLTLTDHLTWDIFASYLAYVGSIEAYSKFVAARYGLDQHHDKGEKDKD